MTKKSRTEKDEKPEASVGFGLGGLLEGIQKLVETAAKLKDSGQISQTGEFEIPGLGEKGKGIFGFSVKTLAGGEGQSVSVRPFGNIHKTAKGVAVEEARESVVDLFEEDDKIRVIAELPGVSEDAIKYEIKGDVLRIWTEGERQYDTEVLLPAEADSENAESTYKNGIFELQLKKTTK